MSNGTNKIKSALSCAATFNILLALVSSSCSKNEISKAPAEVLRIRIASSAVNAVPAAQPIELIPSERKAAGPPLFIRQVKRTSRTVANEQLSQVPPISNQTETQLTSRGASSWVLTPAIGLTNLLYTESNRSPYSALLLTPKLGVSYALSERWILGASAFANLSSFSSNDPTANVRFLGLNARVAFILPEIGSSWKTTLMVGAYSLSMFVSNNSFGFDRLTGPQVVVAERKTLDSKSALSAYLKFSPMIMGSFVSLSNRELAGGISYERKVVDQLYNLSLDASVFDFSIGVFQIQSRTLTFSLGMSL